MHEHRHGMTGHELISAGGAMVLWVCLLTGCASVAPKPAAREPMFTLPAWLGNDVTAVLRRDLVQFTAYTRAQILSTAEQIEARSTDPQVRRAVLIWRINTLPEINDWLNDRHPIERLANAWSYCVRLHAYLGDGEGAELFGESQPLAIEAAAALEARIEAIAQKHLPADRYPEMEQRIEEFVRENRITGLFVYDSAEDFADAAAGQSTLSWLLGAPMRAVTRVSEKLDPTAQLAQSVDRVTALMSDYPTLVRWQAQLLLLSAEQAPGIRQLNTSVERISLSTESLARTATTLPAQIEQSLSGTLEQLDAQQPQLQATLDLARQTAADIALSMQRAEQVSASLERTVTEAKATGEAWQRTADAATATVREIATLRGEPDAASEGATHAASGLPTSTTEGAAHAVSGLPAADAPPAPPFDIRDYQRTADALTAGAQEIRGLLADARTLLEEPTAQQHLALVDKLSAVTLERSADQARGVIDRFAWRMAQLAVLIFVLALAYRVAVRKLAPHKD